MQTPGKGQEPQFGSPIPPRPTELPAELGPRCSLTAP